MTTEQRNSLIMLKNHLPESKPVMYVYTCGKGMNNKYRRVFFAHTTNSIVNITSYIARYLLLRRHSGFGYVSISASPEDIAFLLSQEIGYKLSVEYLK